VKNQAIFALNIAAKGICFLQLFLCSSCVNFRTQQAVPSTRINWWSTHEQTYPYPVVAPIESERLYPEPTSPNQEKSSITNTPGNSSTKVPDPIHVPISVRTSAVINLDKFFGVLPYFAETSSPVYKRYFGCGNSEDIGRIIIYINFIDRWIQLGLLM